MDISAEEKQRIREKIEKLKQSKFKQQTLPAWRPVPTAASTMFTFSMFSAIFFAVGVLLFSMSDQITEKSLRYDDHKDCKEKLQQKDSFCMIDFVDIENKVKGPVYIYYQLNNFYQNHRRYVKSRDNEQLFGTYKTVEKLDACDPIKKVDDLWENQRISFSGKALKGDQPAIPCGLVAKSLFNDTFELHKELKETDTTENITISIDNIAWTSDLDYKFNNIKDAPDGQKWEDVQWLDMKDEHFIVWMRTAGLPNFRKLWGRIDGDLEVGKYKLKIQNNFDVASFSGKKMFVISTTNFLGGKNYFLAYCYMTVGVLCLLFAFIFCVAYMRRRNSSQSQNGLG